MLSDGQRVANTTLPNFLAKEWHWEQAAHSTVSRGIALRQGTAHRPCQAGQCFPAGSSNAAADGQGVSHQPSKANSCGALTEQLQEGSKSQEPLLCPDLLMGRILSKGKQRLPTLILVICLLFLSFEHSPAVTERSLSRNCYLERRGPHCRVKEKVNTVPLSAGIEKSLKSWL